MTSRTLRRVCVSVVTMAALTSVAACGGSDEASGSGGKNGDKSPAAAAAVSPIAALKKVQQKSGSAHSAKVESTIVVGTAMSITSTGSMDWSDGITGDITIKYTGGTMAETMKKMGSDGTMRTVYLKDAYYANMGDAFAQAIGGKHWIRYGYEDLAAVAGASGEVLKDQMQGSTPEKGVEPLLASGAVKKVGEENVRGVATTHYSGVVDVAALSGTSTNLDAEQLKELKEQLDKSGITTETVDLWIDKNDLPIKASTSADTATGAMKTTSFYSDYGAAVSVVKPDAGDTVDFKEIAGQAATTAS
ncbi:hypothetical protein [Streptomyces sp. NBC_00102]|uniref:hypothetical protein n=1 Tax=Streptomyces sp. NBC_00102 TaxID=2975652 RepID=UPI0022561169|nr:hypothetical protein [Streptomyces sp. NBC_00102]MCX5397551.1 hypothetical protein [Streptomyces sp. NBC_00102]